MKRMKMLILIAAVAVILVSTVMGTYAYLTDTASAENTFTVGKVDIELAATDFSLNGQNKLIPSAEFALNPTVTVKAGSEESYIRMLVTISKYDELQAIYGDTVLLQNFVTGWDNGIWASTLAITENTADNTATYEFRYKTTVSTVGAADEVLDPLFTEFTVPTDLTGTQLATLAGLSLKIEAHAIQKAGFDSADAAWLEFHP